MLSTKHWHGDEGRAATLHASLPRLPTDSQSPSASSCCGLYRATCRLKWTPICPSNVAASVARARQIIDAYKQRGVGPERVLIKLASTWKGIRAAQILQREGVKCNMMLLLNRAQAVASAEAGAFLISPFVGRNYDWRSRSGSDVFARRPVKIIPARAGRFAVSALLIGITNENVSSVC